MCHGAWLWQQECWWASAQLPAGPFRGREAVLSGKLVEKRISVFFVCVCVMCVYTHSIGFQDNHVGIHDEQSMHNVCGFC